MASSSTAAHPLEPVLLILSATPGIYDALSPQPPDPSDSKQLPPRKLAENANGGFDGKFGPTGRWGGWNGFRGTEYGANSPLAGYMPGNAAVSGFYSNIAEQPR